MHYVGLLCMVRMDHVWHADLRRHDFIIVNEYVCVYGHRSMLEMGGIRGVEVERVQTFGGLLRGSLHAPPPTLFVLTNTQTNIESTQHS